MLPAGDGGVPAHAVPDGDGDGDFDILAAIVAELVPEGRRLRPLIGIVAGAPAGIQAHRRQQLPLCRVQLQSGVLHRPCGDLHGRIVFQRKIQHSTRGYRLFLQDRHRRIDDKLLVHRPEHQVRQGHPLIQIHIAGIGKLILPVGQVGLHLDDVGMALLPQFFLAAGPLQRLLRDSHLLLVHVAEALVVHHVVVRLHHRQADIGLHLLLPGFGDLHTGPGDLVIVHGLEAVEQVIPGAHAVVVVERGRVEIGIGLRVDAAAEIVVRIRARIDLRGEQGQRRIAPVDLRIADGRLLDPDLRRIGNRKLHAVTERHRVLAGGACCHSKRQRRN